MSRENKLIQFYLTNQCNSRCKTCTIWCNKNEEELPAENVIDVIKQYPDADYVFGGGEFTLYNQKGLLLDFCDSSDVNYTILSNSIDFLALDNVMRKHKVPNLTISCDGINHDKIRGKEGNLKNIEHAIKEYKNKTNLKLSYTYSKYNEVTFEQDMEYFKSLGFNKVYLCLAQDVELLHSNKTVIANDIGNILKHRDMFYDKDIDFIESYIDDKKKVCDSTKSVYTVYTNGDVVMCQSYMSKFVHGNIKYTPFNEIIQGWEGNNKNCPKCEYDDTCNLLCQRRYD